MKNKKVAVAMSGGVDSSVAAAILVEQGYAVTGVYIEAYNEPGCRTDQDKADALKVAMKLGIPFKTLDLRKEYREKVTKYFLETYREGRTPNPDVVCNREIKFGEFFRYARKKGFEEIATGHYCRKARVKNKWVLQRPRDLEKDQSYFLWQVASEELARVRFPLGELTKSEVRQKARELKLSNAEKPDSMGVCMMGQLNVREYLRRQLGEVEGEVVMRDAKGEERVVGKHRGMWTVTIGERVGAEIKLDLAAMQEMGVETTKMPVWYVTRKKVEDKRIEIGRREECYTNKLQIGEVRGEELGENPRLAVRVRNLGELYQVKQFKKRKGGLGVETKTPIFAPASGQDAVFYRGDCQGEEVVVGGGIIV